MWTLVGAGAKTVSASGRSTASVMPSGVKWVKSRVVKLDPMNNIVFTEFGKEVSKKKKHGLDLHKETMVLLKVSLQSCCG